MSRHMIASVVLVLTIALTLFISSQDKASDQLEQQEQQRQQEQPILSQMQEHKINYLGENALVRKLLSYLPVFDENYQQNKFALQTDTEPYGLMIYYEPRENNNGSPMAPSSEEMLVYADYLFQCIGNLGYIEFKYVEPFLETSTGFCCEVNTGPNCCIDDTAIQLLLRVDRE